MWTLIVLNLWSAVVNIVLLFGKIHCCGQVTHLSVCLMIMLAITSHYLLCILPIKDSFLIKRLNNAFDSMSVTYRYIRANIHTDTHTHRHTNTYTQTNSYLIHKYKYTWEIRYGRQHIYSYGCCNKYMINYVVYHPLIIHFKCRSIYRKFGGSLSKLTQSVPAEGVLGNKEVKSVCVLTKNLDFGLLLLR